MQAHAIALRYAREQNGGMGGLGTLPTPTITPTYYPSGTVYTSTNPGAAGGLPNIFAGTPPLVQTSNPSNTALITGLINNGFNFVTALLQRNSQGQTTAQATPFVYNPQTGQFLDTRTGQIVDGPNSRADVDATGDSINLFGQKIKYTTLLVLGLVLFLIQSKGFQKR